MAKIQWNGEDTTLVRLEVGGEKVEVNPGDTFEVLDYGLARNLLKYSRDFELVEGEVSEEGAVKELKAENKALKKRVAELEAELATKTEEPTEPVSTASDASEKSEEVKTEEPKKADKKSAKK